MSDRYSKSSGSTSSSSTNTSTSTETVIVPFERPAACICGPDLYGTLIGPTADESILAGLQAFFQLDFFRCAPAKEHDPTPSADNTSASTGDQSANHRRYRKRRGTHTQRPSYASGGTYSSTGSFSGGEGTDNDEPDSVPISAPLVSIPESVSFNKTIENEMQSSAHEHQTASSNHSPSHHSSHHPKSHHSSKNSSRSAHSAGKSVYSTATNKTSKTTKTAKSNKSHKKVDEEDSNYTVGHKKHHKHHEHRHHNKHGHAHGHTSEAEGGDCCGGCRCHHLPPVCTVIPETCPAVMTTSTFAEGSQTLRSCFGEKNQICQTSASVFSNEIDFDDSSLSTEDYEHHEHNGHKQIHHDQRHDRRHDQYHDLHQPSHHPLHHPSHHASHHPSHHPQHHPQHYPQHHPQHHPQHRSHRHGQGPHGSDHHRFHSPHHPFDYEDKQCTCVKKPTYPHCFCPNNSAPRVFEESDDRRCYCCTPQSGERSVTWRSYKIPQTTNTCCKCESKVSEATSFLGKKVSKAGSCFCKRSSNKSSSFFNRKFSKTSCICEGRPCICKKKVHCCCQAQMTTTNNDQKEEAEKPPNDGCRCTSAKQNRLSDSETDKNVRYAVTKITKFNNYTTFEVLESTKRKPKAMPCCLEGVFVLKNEAE